jgi:hypothetical protein
MAMLSVTEASEFFEALPPALQVPSLHPSYVQADAARDPGISPRYFCHREAGVSYYHGFHVSGIAGTGYRDIQSPYGYGGPVCTSCEPPALARAWGEFSAWCAESGILAEFIRFHPMLKNWQYFGGEALADRDTVCIDLLPCDLLAGYQTRARTAVRKAIGNGLSVAWVDAEHFLEVFPGMYRQAMQQIGAQEFYLFQDRYLRELVSWEKVLRAICLCDGEPVACAMFLLGPELMEYHLSASSERGKKLSAANLILHEAALLAKANGAKQLHLGGGTDTRQDNPLLFFKSGFSREKSEFRIGKAIHDAQAYARLRDDWLKRHHHVANRVLFYRFPDGA